MGDMYERFKDDPTADEKAYAELHQYKTARQLLAVHMIEVHDCLLTESELDDIMHIADLRHQELKLRTR